MGSTNKTPHYNFPQYVDSDKPTWLGDVNDTNKTIDDTLYAFDNDIQTAEHLANDAITESDKNKTDIANLTDNLSTNYYNKTDADAKFLDTTEAYNKTDADAKFLDSTEAYTKDQVYNKSEADTRFASKSDVGGGFTYFVVIGDQYATSTGLSNTNDFWAIKLGVQIGLTPKVYSSDNSGFQAAGTASAGNFSAQLSAAHNDTTISDPNTVQYVLIIGGANDIAWDNYPVYQPLIESAIQYFPKAKIIYGLPANPVDANNYIYWSKNYSQIFKDISAASYRVRDYPTKAIGLKAISDFTYSIDITSAKSNINSILFNVLNEYITTGKEPIYYNQGNLNLGGGSGVTVIKDGAITRIGDKITCEGGIFVLNTPASVTETAPLSLGNILGTPYSPNGANIAVFPHNGTQGSGRYMVGGKYAINTTNNSATISGGGRIYLQGLDFGTDPIIMPKLSWSIYDL